MSAMEGKKKAEKKKKGKEARPFLLNINVGIMGHVDSGKTSLVKALSTTVSTAALDKNPQSQERGMTIDLGFSALTVDTPETLLKAVEASEKLEDDETTSSSSRTQLTLVDCPGHASLIKTIIGGAQIIDVAVLVVDCVKGMQAQTAECLVIAEITTSKLVVVMNKIDQIPEAEREQRLHEAELKIRRRLSSSKFATAPIARVAACVGGEKTASAATASSAENSIGLETLKQVVIGQFEAPPMRDVTGPFFFMIDHCFPIKGQGTVVTGTCLRGSAEIGDSVEFPALGLEKKVKSMQMFRKPARRIACGDRAGVCVAQLDPTTVERGVLAAPNSVPLIQVCVAKVRKVRYFKDRIKTEAKFHITAGHSTAIATAWFFGHRELKTRAYTRGADFAFQDELFPALSTSVSSQQTEGDGGLFDREDNFFPEQYALLRFEDVKIRCQADALLIGSRLDGAEGTEACRIAFDGRVVDSLDKESNLDEVVRLYKMKHKTCDVLKVESPGGDGHYEALCSGLFSKEAPMQRFVGLKLQANTGEIGAISSAFGAKEKFKVTFKTPALVQPGTSALYFRYKRYVFIHGDKAMHQDDDCFYAVGRPPLIDPAVALQTARAANSERRRQDELFEQQRAKRKQQAAKKPTKTAAAALARVAAGRKPAQTPPKAASGTRRGKVERLKGDPGPTGRVSVVIAEGFFSAEEDQRPHVGARVVGVDNGDVGALAGPFGKAGKAKVDFGPNGTSLAVGAPLDLDLQHPPA